MEDKYIEIIAEQQTEIDEKIKQIKELREGLSQRFKIKNKTYEFYYNKIKGLNELVDFYSLLDDKQSKEIKRLKQEIIELNRIINLTK